MNNSPDFGNVIYNRDKSDLHVDFKRTVRNYQQNCKSYFKVEASGHS